MRRTMSAIVAVAGAIAIAGGVATGTASGAIPDISCQYTNHPMYDPLTCRDYGPVP